MDSSPTSPPRDPSVPWRYALGQSAVEIGRFTYGVEDMRILQWREGANLTIGAFCSISRGTLVLLGGNHRVDWGTTYPFGKVFKRQLGGTSFAGHPETRGDVVIGNDVWIARGASILSGVTIGDGAVVATNATVTRSIGPYEIWGGNPARLIRPRFPEAIAARLHALRWWDQPLPVIRALAPLLSQEPTEAVLAEMEALVVKKGPE